MTTVDDGVPVSVRPGDAGKGEQARAGEQLRLLRPRGAGSGVGPAPVGDPEYRRYGATKGHKHRQHL